MILQQDNLYAVPILHYKMEFAAAVHSAFEKIQPDCVAVELPEPLTPYFLQAASRLPDITLVAREPLFYMCEPCDGAMEALRCALQRKNCDSFCIDLEVKGYPDFLEPFPDPYTVTRIGFKKYYEAYQETVQEKTKHPLDVKRELHMARRLKELSLQYDKVLFVGGFHHVEDILKESKRSHFPTFSHEVKEEAYLCTLTEEATRDCMAESAWTTLAFEESRSLLDRQQLLYSLYKTASHTYHEQTKNSLPLPLLKTTLKYARNLSFLQATLTPNLHEALVAAKGCVDDLYAYEVWLHATTYPFRKNSDDLPELDLTPAELWGNERRIHFRFKEKRRKGHERGSFYAPSFHTLCSYPKEDVIIETLCNNLKQKAKRKQRASIPFSSSLEEGLDIRETLRKWHEKKLYVIQERKLGSNIGSVVVIFDEDRDEKYPWKMTWIGEHAQESDMAFYATPIHRKIVGPGISRCEYGGFLMTSPPRRLMDIWEDPDYLACETKADCLLMAAIDYSLEPSILYLGKKPPKPSIKHFASRFGKKIIYQPLNSTRILNKIQTFHVLDGHDKRKIADEYI